MAETVRYVRVTAKIETYVDGTDGARLQKTVSYDKVFVEGTDDDEVGAVFIDEARPLNTTSEDLDVAGGLTDFQGAALALNNIKLLWAENEDTDSGDTLTLAPGSTAPVTSILSGTSPVLTIGPGGLCLLVNPGGYAVTATSADKLQFTTADNSTYTLVLAGDNEA